MDKNIILRLYQDYNFSWPPNQNYHNLQDFMLINLLLKKHKDYIIKENKEIIMLLLHSVLAQCKYKNHLEYQFIILQNKI